MSSDTFCGVQVRVVMDELFHLQEYGGMKLLYITPEKYSRRCFFVLMHRRTRCDIQGHFSIVNATSYSIFGPY